MELRKKAYPSHTPDEKEYCINVMTEIRNQLPAQYTLAAMNELRRMGITDLDDYYIRQVRNLRMYNRDVADALKAICKPVRFSGNSLSQKLDKTLASIN